MNRIVNDRTEAGLLHILQQELPDFDFKSATLIPHSWDNTVLEVNGEYIFRFPKDDEYPFEAEVNILRYLQGKVSVETPNVLFLGKEYMFMGYPKILGLVISEQKTNTLEHDIKEHIAEDAAAFLLEFHNAIPIDVARDLKVKEVRMSTFADSILPTIPQHFPRNKKLIHFAEEAVVRYQQMKEDDYPKRVLHWDLHIGNMIFKEDFSLKGVIDFGDIEIGDIHADFHPFYKFDTEIAEMALTAYSKISCLKLSLERVKVYAWINELSDVAETVEDPTNHAYQKSMKRIVKWMSEEL